SAPHASIPPRRPHRPASHPVLTGWFAGPKADAASSLAASELVEIGIASLAEIFGRSPEGIKKEVVASRAINWGNDPFARGAYSYATPKTRRQLASIVIRGAGTARESGTQEHTLIKA